MTSCPWRPHPPGTRRDIPSGCWRQDTQGWTSLRNRQRQRTKWLRTQSGNGLVASYITRKVVFMYCFRGWNLFFCLQCPQQYITQLPAPAAPPNWRHVDCHLLEVTHRLWTVASHVDDIYDHTGRHFQSSDRKSSGALDGSWTHQDTERLIDKRGEWKMMLMRDIEESWLTEAALAEGFKRGEAVL